MARRLAAIMFTDIAGYTAMTQADEAGALRLLQEQEKLVRPALEAHRGRKVKSMGDGLLFEFPDVLDAVECGVELQRRVHERNAQEDSPPLRIRVGIHLGDVQRRGTDILGDAVNIASRIEPLAEPGGVCLSFPVYDQVHNKVTCEFEKLGSRTLRGVRDPVGVYRVVFPWSTPVFVPAGPLLPRIAVLPLASISPDPNDAYFADGLTEEMISVLSQIKGLRVISHTSVNQYKGTKKPVTQVGAELGADTVLEGSVRKAGDQIRIAVQLIDTRTDEHRWSQTYDRMLENVFAIQAEVAERTAKELKVELLSSEREAIQERPTSSLTAYEFYLKGTQAFREIGTPPPSGFYREAVRCFEAAVREDPRFAAAKAYLALELLLMGASIIPQEEAFPRARDLATQALELNPNSSDAHMAVGGVLFQVDLNWAGAEAEFQQAIALNPSNAFAHWWYGFLLWTLQRFAEARKQALESIELDPLCVHPRVVLADSYGLSGDYDSGAKVLRKAIDVLGDNPWLRRQLLWHLSYAGRVDETLELLATFQDDHRFGARFGRACLLGRLGRLDELRSVMADLEDGRVTEYFDPLVRAWGYSLLGEREKALTTLEEEHRKGHSGLWNSYQEPTFDRVRDDPRFMALLKAMNLPTTLTRPRWSPPSHLTP